MLNNNVMFMAYLRNECLQEIGCGVKGVRDQFIEVFLGKAVIVF